jgi:hypothetical protein
MFLQRNPGWIPNTKPTSGTRTAKAAIFSRWNPIGLEAFLAAFPVLFLLRGGRPGRERCVRVACRIAIEIARTGSCHAARIRRSTVTGIGRGIRRCRVVSRHRSIRVVLCIGVHLLRRRRAVGGQGRRAIDAARGPGSASRANACSGSDNRHSQYHGAADSGGTQKCHVCSHEIILGYTWGDNAWAVGRSPIVPAAPQQMPLGKITLQKRDVYALSSGPGTSRNKNMGRAGFAEK